MISHYCSKLDMFIPYSVPDSVIDRKVFWWYTLHSVWPEAYIQFPNVPHIHKEVVLDRA